MGGLHFLGSISSSSNSSSSSSTYYYYYYFSICLIGLLFGVMQARRNLSVFLKDNLWNLLEGTIHTAG